MPTKECYGKAPKSPYAWQKSAIEDYARICWQLWKLDIVCLRYFNVFGPGQYGDSPYATAVSAWCNAVHNNSPLRSDGDGTQTRDMVYVGDVVKANILAAIREERFNAEAINIATGSSISNNQFIDNFLSRFPGIQVVHAPERPGDVKHTLSDITLMRHVLGLTETTSFELGLEETLRWWSSVGESSG